MKFAKEIKLGKRKVGAGHPAYVIAEIGANFDGDLKRAKHLADLSKKAGADAFKIQLYTTPQIASDVGFRSLTAFEKKWGQPVVELYKAMEFPYGWVKDIAQHCKKIGIDFIASAYDTTAIDLLEKLGVVAHKLGAGELTNLEFIEYVAKTGTPVIMSAGAATMEETVAAVNAIKKTGNKNLILLQCNTSYPSPLSDSNITVVPTFAKKFGVVVGYSDHTIGKEGGGDDPLDGLTVPLGAVALGATVIEKHVTDDRSRTQGSDHAFALTFQEFTLMVKGIRAMEVSLGNGEKEVMPSEKSWRVTQRRGIYAVHDLPKGKKLTRDMLITIRPAVGVSASLIKKVLGKKLKRAIPAGHPVKASDIGQ